MVNVGTVSMLIIASLKRPSIEQPEKRYFEGRFRETLVNVTSC